MSEQRQHDAGNRDEAVLEDVVERVVKLIANIRKRQAAVTRTHGVTMLQSTAIQILRESGPINITQLSKKLHLNQSTVSSLVDRMERDRLVRRVQSSKDRRSVRLRLTDKADDIGGSLPTSPLDFFRTLLRVLSTEEQVALAGLLTKIEKAFGKGIAELDAKHPLRKPKSGAA